MGGSSLCAEVLRSVFGIAPRATRSSSCSTRPTSARSRRRPRAWIPSATLFLVASKSGGTVEVASMERFFWARMSGDAGRRRRTALRRDHRSRHRAREARRRRAATAKSFLNPPDIGGRFSALSLFGLVPAALIGAPVDSIARGGAAMAEGCRQDNHANPGLELGAFIGAAALDGRDKLTVALSPSLRVARPVDRTARRREHRQARQGRAAGRRRSRSGGPDEYGNDRAFVAVATESDAPDDEARLARARSRRPSGAAADDAARRARRRVLPLGVRDRGRGRGARHQSVRRAERLGSQGEDQGAARQRYGDGRPEPVDAARTRRCSARLRRDARRDRSQRDRVIEPGDYVAFLSYLPADERRRGGDRCDDPRRLRARHSGQHVRRRPAYLHSTGQYHKGGPNTAVAFVHHGGRRDRARRSRTRATRSRC